MTIPSLEEKAAALITECWPWRGPKQSRGYGFLYLWKRHTLAHRFIYEMIVGPIPEGMDILHSCDNPACVNPTHLRVGTPKENIRDSLMRGRFAVGERHYNAKLDDASIREIRAMHANGMTQAAIAKVFGVRHTAIQKIVSGKAWKHVATRGRAGL